VEQPTIVCDPVTHAGDEYNLRGGITELITVMGLSHALHDHGNISVGSIMCSRDITTRQQFFECYGHYTHSLPEHDLTGCAFALLRCDQLAGAGSNRLTAWLAGLAELELARIAEEAERVLWLLDSEKLRLLEAVEQVAAML